MQDKIHVLYLHSQPGFNADSAIHAHLMRYLDRERFVVHVASARSDGSGPAPATTEFEKIPDVHLLPTNFAPGFHHRSRETIARELFAATTFPIDYARLAAYIRRHRIRIIHGTDRPRDAVYSLTLGKLTGAKSIVHVHVAWSHGYSTAAKWGVHNADAVFSISKFVTGTVVATGTPLDRIYTVLNSVDPSRWNPDADGSSVRGEFGVAPGAPLLLSVSRLFAQKGQRELLRALAIVKDQIPDVRLFIVGGDVLHISGSSFTEELKTLAQELGVTKHVIFTGPRSDIPQFMAACDVFSMPSLEEPFGLVFLEAMAMRKPVVAVNDGGTPEVVEDGRSGLLAPAKDVEALARNVVTLLRDRTLRARMGDHGRARVLDYFNTRRMAKDAGAAYEAMLQR